MNIIGRVPFSHFTQFTQFIQFRSFSSGRLIKTKGIPYVQPKIDCSKTNQTVISTKKTKYVPNVIGKSTFGRRNYSYAHMQAYTHELQLTGTGNNNSIMYVFSDDVTRLLHMESVGIKSHEHESGRCMCCSNCSMSGYDSGDD